MRSLAWVAAVGLCAAAGCARKPAADGGGAAGWRADKARQSAEALALHSVTAAAEAQAKAVPELYREPKPTAEQVREQRAAERLPVAVRGTAGVVAVALVAFLFLRASRRASGPRTAGLALLSAALAGGAAVHLVSAEVARLGRIGSPSTGERAAHVPTRGNECQCLS